MRFPLRWLHRFVGWFGCKLDIDTESTPEGEVVQMYLVIRRKR